MCFISDFFRAYVDMMEDAGFIEGIITFVLFVVWVLMVLTLLFMAVVTLIVVLYNLWSGAGADAAVEGQAMPPAVEVAALPAGGEQAARVVRRRRAARDSASGESGSSPSSIVESERE